MTGILIGLAACQSSGPPGILTGTGSASDTGEEPQPLHDSGIDTIDACGNQEAGIICAAYGSGSISSISDAYLGEDNTLYLLATFGLYRTTLDFPDVYEELVDASVHYIAGSDRLEYEPVTGRLHGLAGAGWTVWTYHVPSGALEVPEPIVPSMRFTGFAVDGSGGYYLTAVDDPVVVHASGASVLDMAGAQNHWGYAGDGGPASDALLYPADPDSSNSSLQGGLDLTGGHLYIADTWNSVVREIDLSTGLITTAAGAYSPLAGSESTYEFEGETLVRDPMGVGGFAGDGGRAVEALLSAPTDVVKCGDSLFIADTGNACVREVREGIISTAAGTCSVAGIAGDGGPATEAQLLAPIAVDCVTGGHLLIVDDRAPVPVRIVYGVWNE